MFFDDEKPTGGMADGGNATDDTTEETTEEGTEETSGGEGQQM